MISTDLECFEREIKQNRNLKIGHCRDGKCIMIGPRSGTLTGLTPLNDIQKLKIDIERGKYPGLIAENPYNHYTSYMVRVCSDDVLIEDDFHNREAHAQALGG